MSNAIANQLFLAYLGRPADTQWRNTTGTLLNGAAPSAALQTAFYNAAVADGVFATTDSPSTLVNKIFNQIFGFGASTFEQTQWGNLISTGMVTAQSAAWTIFSSYLGATNVPASYQVPAQSKLVAAEAYVLQLGNDAAANAALSQAGSAAATSARTFLSGITTQAQAATAVTNIATTVSAVGTSTTGSTFTLTTGADNFTGTSGNDTFNGAIDDNTAANNTFSVLDAIAGGAGTSDTFNLTGDASGAGIAFPAANVSGIEVFNLRNVSGQTLTVNTSLFAGETAIYSDRSTDQVTLTGVSSGTTLGMKGDGTTTNGKLALTTAASVTSLTLDISGGTTAGAIEVSDTADSLTALTINSSGASNTIGAIDLDIDAGVNAIKTLNIVAATNLTTGAITNFAASSTINVSGAASSVNVNTIENANVTTLNASGLTAGGVTATLSTLDTITVTGGAGNDVITTGATLTTGSVNAGAGTADRLVVGTTAHLNSAALGAKYTNFEVLQVNNGVDVDLDHISGITAVRMNDAGGTTVLTDLSATQAANVTLLALTGAATIVVKDATQTGTADTLNIAVTDGDSTTSEAIAGTGNLTIAGVETITITATDDITLDTMANVTGMTKLTVSGVGDVSITTAAMAVQANLAVDFSGLTAATTFNFAAATGNALAFTGSAVADTVTESAIGGNVIRLGAGNDTLNFTEKTGGSTAPIIFGGAGADTMNLGDAQGNDARDIIVFRYVAGDSISVSGATNGVNTTTVTDTISSVRNNQNAAADDGNVFRIDTEQTATTVQFTTTAVTLGTTTVTAAFGFYVLDINAGTANNVIVYQDTDGDSIIEAGEFAVQLAGAAQFTTGEFTISTGDLLFTSVA
jgi:hypothetical protein